MSHFPAHSLPPSLPSSSASAAASASPVPVPFSSSATVPSSPSLSLSHDRDSRIEGTRAAEKVNGGNFHIGFGVALQRGHES